MGGAKQAERRSPLGGVWAWARAAVLAGLMAVGEATPEVAPVAVTGVSAAKEVAARMAVAVKVAAVGMAVVVKVVEVEVGMAAGWVVVVTGGVAM